MKNEKFSLRKRIKSLGYAFNGLKIMFMEEHNSRIHLVAAIIVIIAGFLLKISLMEWVLLAIVIGSVFISELFNSALENLANHLSPGQSDNIGKAKDLAAAAVLVSAFIAILTGCVIFLPKIYILIKMFI
jgi:diacylglycerol kinase (ATP)